ncbi:S-layer homology domain-containing protein [Psychrobacillus sp. FSL H8-0487]|uniref:S-layer homology domain-containing protein n=1 Tax=Psychrobacillus sp. FSL H8-0487 TaxID=2921391 RepID=UPI0030FAD9BE
MKNKLFLSALASAMVIPAIVIPSSGVLTEAATVKANFTDVAKGSSYYTIIHEMRDKGVINGYEDGTFKPLQEVSRKHVAVLLARALPLEPIRASKEFTDVPKSHPYHAEIQKMYRAGIVDGSQGKFNPDQPLSRVQMAKILDLAFKLDTKNTFKFPDVSSDHWGNQHVQALYSNGITTGDNGLFKPNAPVTRQHYAVFLHRALNLDKDVKPTPTPEPTEPTEPEVVIPDETLDLIARLDKIVKANEDLFIDGAKPFNQLAILYNPISAKFYSEGLDVVRANKMQVYTGREGWGPEFDNLDSTIRLTSKGYTNPTPRLGKSEFLFVPSNEDKEGTFSYDFRSDKALNVAEEWMEIGFPHLADKLLPMMKSKVMDARQQEKNGTFLPNDEVLIYEGYKINIGVDTFYEGMTVQMKFE